MFGGRGGSHVPSRTTSASLELPRFAHVLRFLTSDFQWEEVGIFSTAGGGELCVAIDGPSFCILEVVIAWEKKRNEHLDLLYSAHSTEREV